MIELLALLVILVLGAGVWFLWPMDPEELPQGGEPACAPEPAPASDAAEAREVRPPG